MSSSSPPYFQASEVNYQLHSLGWKAFQNLCLTITTEIFGQLVQGFFDSHDGGRDGAFYGNWERKGSEGLNGSFTVQCKFTAKTDKSLKLADLKDELKKAERLAAKGLSDNYLLFTNARLTGTSDEIVRKAFESIQGIKSFTSFGVERISQIIRESPRLRMLVPRVYGLGDLSQIMDYRAYDQAQEILSALGDDLSKFVITGAFKQSAQALIEHGFVLLLGEPACGKSTIAAALAVGALDEWGCSTIKARNADDFIRHFNPHEKQLFWVDDAFGATQLDFSSAYDWSQSFPHVNAAIHRGSKVVFTSRDYIYNSAKRYLKESALPVIKESQVVIHVENMSKDEREQILYNHIRLGNQGKDFKAKIKELLPIVASHERFSPEVARRLGNSFFTKELSLTKTALTDFVARPVAFLVEVINMLDDGSRSALALVFMRGGAVTSPISMTDAESQAVSRLGGAESKIVEALNALKGSLVVSGLEKGTNIWRFKHPTVRDAFAQLVASNLELMDIYLTGAPITTLLSEVSCGNVGVEGVKVIVPQERYSVVFDRLETLEKDWHGESVLNRFLSWRCSQEFLNYYIQRKPEFINGLSVRSYLGADSEVDVLVRLNSYNLLPEDKRKEVVAGIKELAVNTPDSGFLRQDIKTLLQPKEINDVLEHVKQQLLPSLDSCIEEWRDNYDADEDPEAYMDGLKSTLRDYEFEFEGDEHAVECILEAYGEIDQVIDDLQDEYSEDPDDRDYFGRSDFSSSTVSERSIFDDVDS